MTRKRVVKVNRKIRYKIISGIVLCIIMFFLMISGILCSFSQLKKISLPKEDIAVEETQPKEYQVKLFMVGDALIHSAIYQDAKTEHGYDFIPMLQYIKPISSTYPLAYYNQETILGGSSLGYSNYPRFNSPQEVGDAFVDAGFNLVSLATNHTMDKGEAGVLNSVAYWKGKEKVVTSGQWESFEERNKAQVYEVNGISYAFFSYTTWTNGLETPVGKEYLNNVYSEEVAKEDIEKVRGLVDFVIVAMHWGTEYSTGVSSSQEQIASYLSSLGVDLIIGAHPHVVEPVEYINEGKTFVIYSLGNFISDQIGTERLTGLMMEVTLQKKIDRDEKVITSIVEPKAELIYTKSDYSRKRNFRVYPYSSLDNTILPNYRSYYEQYKSIVSSRYPELMWGITGSD